MTAVEIAFNKYLLETFEQVFDSSNIDHLTKLAIFEAGWEAHFVYYQG